MRLCRHGMLGGFVLLLSVQSLQGWTPKFIVAPPRTSREWKQMAAIEVKVFDDFKWWEFRERKATEMFVMQQYVDTSNRMKGSKYALLVATEESKNVVGMVEMGVSLDTITNATRTTIGVLCVSPKCQRSGVGARLMQKCEQVATTEGWNETTLYAEVESYNTEALNFFEKHGFVRTTETQQTVKVRRRRLYEERPHLLLSKAIATNDSS